MLLPFWKMTVNTENAIDALIDLVGRSSIEAVLLLSDQEIAGGRMADHFGQPVVIAVVHIQIVRYAMPITFSPPGAVTKFVLTDHNDMGR